MAHTAVWCAPIEQHLLHCGPPLQDEIARLKAELLARQQAGVSGDTAQGAGQVRQSGAAPFMDLTPSSHSNPCRVQHGLIANACASQRQCANDRPCAVQVIERLVEVEPDKAAIVEQLRQQMKAEMEQHQQQLEGQALEAARQEAEARAKQQLEVGACSRSFMQTGCCKAV